MTETISRYENDKAPIPPTVRMLVGAMVSMEGIDEALSALLEDTREEAEAIAKPIIIGKDELRVFGKRKTPPIEYVRKSAVLEQAGIAQDAIKALNDLVALEQKDT